MELKMIIIVICQVLIATGAIINLIQEFKKH